MTSPIIFHNLFDDDEPDLDTEDSLRVVAVPVLYSVGELFNMMAECNTAAASHNEDTEGISERSEEDLEKAGHIRDVEMNKPVKKLRPSRPLKNKKATIAATITPTSDQEPIKKQASEETTNEEISDHREKSEVVTDGSKEITLKMGSRHVKPATAEEEVRGINLGNVNKPHKHISVLSPIVIKQEKVESDGKVLPLKQSTGITVNKFGDKISNTAKVERKIPTAVKVKKEPVIVKTERLSLPSTVRVTLIKEEVSIEQEVEVKTNEIEESNKVLTSKIAEKEEFILSQQKIINELDMKNVEVNQKLSLREEFIDSQQKVIDDLEKESINAHKVEKLENDLKEKENIISKLLDNEEQWKSKLQDSEECFQTQQLLLEDLKQQFSMVKSDNWLKLTENKQLVEKCTTLEKENQVLVEIGNSHRSASEDIMKTVEALKGKIDDVMGNDSREEELRSKITSLKKENSNLKCLQTDLEEKIKGDMDTKLKENNLLDKAVSEKIETNTQLEKEVSRLSEKLKDSKKNFDGKASKVSKLDKENIKLKDKMKESEIELEAKSKELTSLKRSLDDKTAVISSTEEGLERSKSKLTEMEERLNLETGKSVELIKKLNFSEKLLFTKENDYLVIKDQQLFLETKLRSSQRKVEECEKDNIKFVEANLKVKCLEDEKRDLLKEIRKVSELQKKVKFLECKLKKYYNFYKKHTSQSEHQEDLDVMSKSPNLEVMDIPDPKEIDEILNRISQDVTKHTESVAAEVSIKEIPLPSIEQTEIESTKLISNEVHEPQKGSCDALKEKDNSEQSNTSIEDEDGLLNAWRSRMKQANFSGYPVSSNKLSDFATFSPKHQTGSKDVPLKSPHIGTDTSKDATVDVDDVVVISSRSSKKKQVSSDSDLDSEEDMEGSRRHKSKKSKKKKKFKRKKDEKESERSRERKKHRSRRKSRSPTKSRSRTRSRSRNSRRRVHKEGRKSRSGSRSTSVHFREKIRNISCSPVKGSKRARSPSPRKPLSQNSTSHASPSKRSQPRSRSPAVVKEANFALSKEISSIIEKLQEAKSETSPNNPTLINETASTKTGTRSFKNATPAMKDDEALTKVTHSNLPTNIVANYSSEFEEISDEEMTLAEDCLDELDRTDHSKKEDKSSLNELPCFELVSETKTSAVEEDEKMFEEKVEIKNDSKNEAATIDVTKPVKDTSADIDHTLSVFWNLNCSCCGAKLTGSPTEDAQHYEEGECKKKSDWLKQGLPLICAYCTQSGSHWVAACPLLASFCFTCWTWGHSMDTHKEEGEKSIVRLLASYNRFRLNHLANTGRSEQYKVFPSNSKVDGMWKFMGSMDDVDSVSKKIPGHMGKPVGWLVKENWASLRGFVIKNEVQV